MRTAIMIEIDADIKRQFKVYLANHGLTARETLIRFIEKTIKETK